MKIYLQIKTNEKVLYMFNIKAYIKKPLKLNVIIN